jgi:Cd2+/Zn2+-exporting ATPase
MLVSLATAGAVVMGASSEAALVNVLFLIGEMLEGLAARRARDGIRALGKLIPRTALLVEGDATRSVPIDSLGIGQVVLVRPGDRVPVDGKIIDGSSDLDESAVTGESIPVPKRPGGIVVAGSVNTTGALKVEVTRRVEDNTINRIIHMVEEAQATKAPTARLIDRFSYYYTPIAILTAALTMVLPPLAFGADWTTWIYRGLGLLLVACPCALVLSTPAAIASALAAGARLGLLIKGGAALEAIGSARTVAFDKTGTLTVGKPVVTDILPIAGTENALLGLAAAVEQGSSHPIARAITDRAATKRVSIPSATEQRAVPGKSVEGVVAGARIEILSPRHAASLDYVPDTHPTISVLEESGKTVVVVVKDKAPIGFIAVRDEPRPDAVAAITRVRQLGVTPIMLSGDNRRTAGAVGKALGLEARAELLPDDKLREIARLKSQGTVVMVGDGINDAPALAAADVGIAMGGGTDVALETADAALLHERVGGVADMIELSQRTRRNIAQNVVIALGLKAIFLVTTITGATGLWFAIMADTGATILVTLNALRLLRFTGREQDRSTREDSRHLRPAEVST